MGHVAPIKIEEICARADLSHQRVVLRQHARVLVVPDDHVTIGPHEHAAERVVCVPKLHVGAVGGVADVQGIKDQQPAIIARVDRIDQPAMPVAAHLIEIWQDQTSLSPFREGQRCRPDFGPVSIIGRAIAKARALAWINLATVAEMRVHGPPPGTKASTGTREKDAPFAT